MSMTREAVGRPSVRGPHLLFAAAVFAAAALIASTATSLSPALTLAILSLGLILAAGAVALFAWAARQANAGPQLTYWDVAGALMLIGIAAGIMGEPGEVARLLDRPAPS